jgi:Ca2+-binding EF-hand superfamily protein
LVGKVPLNKTHSLMKTISVSPLLLGLLLPAVSLAQPPQDSPRYEKDGKRGLDRPFVEAWKIADANRDGFISKEEFAMMPRLEKLPEEKRVLLFERIDKNGDGKLGRDELMQMAGPRDGAVDQPEKRLWELDTDRSGGISFEELKAGPIFKKLSPEKQQRLFARLDTDGDGVITPQDKPEPPFKRPEGHPHPDHPRPDRERQDEGERPEQINRKLDVNGDGSLSFEEFRAGPAMKKLSEDQQEDRFELLDRNQDQKISPEDFPPPPSQ